MLRAIGWDDPRCLDPLRAGLDEWCDTNGMSYQVGTRPLTAFNDQPLDELASECDVMVIDHPHMAAAVAAGAALPLDIYVPADELAAIRGDALGSNFSCYEVGGRPYAFHADAACHVSAARHQLLNVLGEALPTDMAGAVALARRHKGAVVWPLYHTDAVSSLLSLLAEGEAAPLVDGPFCTVRSAGVAAIEAMAELAALMPPACWDFTPQRAFQYANDLPVAYIPFAFSYLRAGVDDTPYGRWSMAPTPAGRGSVLGGAGLAVSASSPHAEAASRFVSWYCQPETLLRLVKYGAQPGSIAAWTPSFPEPHTARFFGEVQPILETAWVRPQAVWWPHAQIAAGEALVDGLRRSLSASQILDQIETAYAAVRQSF